MEARGVLGFCVAFFFFVCAPYAANAYSDQTTHPGLSREGVALYDSIHPERPLSVSEEDQLVQGSIDEDQGYRFMRHFYDPVHRTGLTFLSSANYDMPWSSSLDWGTGKDPENQGFTWADAVTLYKDGKKNEAFRVLGHVAHLVEDLTVPDHTRDDPHPPILNLGSPYEAWTKQFGPGKIGLVASSSEDQRSEVYYEHIEDAFEKTARFTNSNFFSKDTANQDYFPSPSVSFRSFEVSKNGEYVLFAYRYVDGEQIPRRLARVVKHFSFYSLSFEDAYVLTDPDSRVLSDYWNTLSWTAVRSVSGLISLFLAEVDSAQIVHFPPVQKKPLFDPFIHPVRIFQVLVDRVSEEPKTKNIQVVPVEMSAQVYLPTAPEVHLLDTESGDPTGLVLASPHIQASPSLEPSDRENAEESHDGTVSEDLASSDTETATSTSIPIDENIVFTGPTRFSLSSGTSTYLVRSQSPYIVDSFETIPEGHTLFVEPGVVVKFAENAGFRVLGDIQAVGSSPHPIIFTSLFDDDFMGDTDGGGVCGSSVEVRCPQPGSWGRLEFAESSQSSLFDHVLFRYGGSAPNPFFAAYFFVDNGKVHISHSILEHALGFGIRLFQSDSTITDTIIRDGNHGGFNAVGLEMSGASPDIERNVVEGFSTGYQIGIEGGVVRDNMARGNGLAYLHAFTLGDVFENNDAEKNQTNGIFVQFHLADAIHPFVVLERNKVPYLIQGAFADIPASTTVKINPGVSIKVSGNFLSIRGTALFEGTADLPILITTPDDDSDGNDLFGDGPRGFDGGGGTGIVFHEGAQVTLSHVHMSHYDVPLTCFGAHVSISDLVLSHTGANLGCEQ